MPDYYTKYLIYKQTHVRKWRVGVQTCTVAIKEEEGSAAAWSEKRKRVKEKEGQG